jgi:thiosulfate reductase cytochrome b subunit
VGQEAVVERNQRIDVSIAVLACAQTNPIQQGSSHRQQIYNEVRLMAAGLLVAAVPILLLAGLAAVSRQLARSAGLTTRNTNAPVKTRTLEVI